MESALPSYFSNVVYPHFWRASSTSLGHSKPPRNICIAHSSDVFLAAWPAPLDFILANRLTTSANPVLSLITVFLFVPLRLTSNIGLPWPVESFTMRRHFSWLHSPCQYRHNGEAIFPKATQPILVFHLSSDVWYNLSSDDNRLELPVSWFH